MLAARLFDPFGDISKEERMAGTHTRSRRADLTAPKERLSLICTQCGRENENWRSGCLGEPVLCECGNSADPAQIEELFREAAAYVIAQGVLAEYQPAIRAKISAVPSFFVQVSAK